jgi:exodeoxyribonuclease V beta subunit
MKPVFQHAITPLEPGVSVIAASAGTGKTFTLAALVVRLVAELGVPIQRLLLTTYTVAATAELRDRIRARLMTALAAVKAGEPGGDDFLAALLPNLPERAAEHLEAAVRDFDEATIHTIHGFCQRALRELAFETGTSFAPELVTDSTALFSEITEDYWRQHIYAAPAGISASLAASSLNLEKLRAALRDLAGKTNTRVIPDAADYEPAKAQLLALLDEFRNAWPSWSDAVKRLLDAENNWGKRGYYAEELRPRVAMMKPAAARDAGGAALVEACKAFCHLTSSGIREGTNSK